MSVNQRFNQLDVTTDVTQPAAFTPSPLRGHDLLDAVFAHIKSIPVSDVSPGNSLDGESWDQGLWLYVDNDAVQKLIDQRSDALTPVDPTDVHGNLRLDPGVAINECGTAACFAGHTGLMVGDGPLVGVDYDHGRAVLNGDWGRLVDVDGNVRDARDRARELLGLEYWQAECLFSAENTIDDLEKVIGWIKEGWRGEAIYERYREEISAFRG